MFLPKMSTLINQSLTFKFKNTYSNYIMYCKVSFLSSKKKKKENVVLFLYNFELNFTQ